MSPILKEHALKSCETASGSENFVRSEKTAPRFKWKDAGHWCASPEASLRAFFPSTPPGLAREESSYCCALNSGEHWRAWKPMGKLQIPIQIPRKIQGLSP